MGRNARFQRGAGGKVGPKLEKLSFFQGNQGQLFQVCPRRIEALLLHILDPNSFILSKMSQNL